MGNKKARKCKPSAKDGCKFKANFDIQLTSMFVIALLAILPSWKNQLLPECSLNSNSEDSSCHQVLQNTSLQ